MKNEKQNIEVSDIFHRYGKEYLEKYKLCPVQHKAFNDIVSCRSESLGGHVQECDNCGFVKYAYNSCRNRHCPKCQYIKQIQWVDKLKSKLPPTRYFHLVFTIPQYLNKLFYLNQAAAYKLLFTASARALKICANNPRYLGAQTGSVAVLHTWGQTLNYHPHIHMIVPAGGLSDDNMEWIPAPMNFFLPVKVLGALFRGILCNMIQQEIKSGKMKLPDDYQSFRQLKDLLYSKPWNVYAKKPLAGPNRVIEYLGKYTHRVAISNHRIISDDDARISFKCKDSKTGLFTRQVTLDALEFIDRFMRHILPSGFYKIRYYGIMSLGTVSQKTDLCFELIEKDCYLPVLEGLPAIDVYMQVSNKNPFCCPVCQKGKMKIIHKTIEPIKSG